VHPTGEFDFRSYSRAFCVVEERIFSIEKSMTFDKLLQKSASDVHPEPTVVMQTVPTSTTTTTMEIQQNGDGDGGAGPGSSPYSLHRRRHQFQMGTPSSYFPALQLPSGFGT